MSKNPVSIVFTGQVREKETFAQSLAEMAGLECVKEVILATWHNEAQANHDFLAGLSQQYGLKVVTTTNPELEIGKHGGLLQSLTLKRGLEAVQSPEQAWVFKTRTDSSIDPEAIRYLAQKDHTITSPAARQLRIFQDKVSVISASTLVPFYIEDQMFFGRHADIAKLCSADFSLFKYDNSPKIAHYIRFYPPFMGQFPLFAPFFRHEILLSTSNLDIRQRLLPHFLARPEFLLMLMVYYRIVADFFCLDWNGHAITLRGQTPEYLSGQEPDVLRSGQTQCASNAYFRAASRGQFVQPELQALFAEASARIASFADLRDAWQGMDFTHCWDGAIAEAHEATGYSAQVALAMHQMQHGGGEGMREAHRVLSLQLQAFPFDLQLRYLLGLVYASVGDRKNAQAFLKSCLDLGAAHDSPAGQLLQGFESS